MIKYLLGALIASFFFFIFLTVAECSYYGTPEGRFPRVPFLDRIPVVRKIYVFVEDTFSGLLYILGHDLKGALYVLAYTFLTGLFFFVIAFTRATFYTGWQVVIVLLTIIQIIMMLSLGARYVYEGNRIRELVSVALAALMVKSSIGSSSSLLVGGYIFAKFILPLIFAVMVFAMIITYVVRFIKDHNKETSA